MQISIRQEKKEDFQIVEKIIQAAFIEVEHSDQSEHLLVARLRQSDAFIPELSLVVEIGGEIVGHILLTKIKINNVDGSYDSLALAPVSVSPAHQGKGIGSALIRKAHEVAKSLGHGSIVLLGHENYYPRFGYELTSKYGIQIPFEAPEENCMVIELKKGALNGVSGTVEYSKAFFG